MTICFGWSRCTIAAIAIACLLGSGCAIWQAPIDKAGITPMTRQNTPTSPFSWLKLSGRTRTLAYSAGAWQFARLPCVSSDSGDLVMLDTGMDVSAHVTLDIVRDEGYPVRLGKSENIAYVPSLSLGGVAARQFVAEVDATEWEFSILGLPIYQARAWTLGTGVLEWAKYLAFDNRDQQVTIGLESFQRWRNVQWVWYGMFNANNRPRVWMPVAGTQLQLLADSGGGPRLILDQPQWEQIQRRVKVMSNSRDAYPTWYGMQAVDVYVVRELEFGPLMLRNEPVWVRRGDSHRSEPSFGLGLLKDSVAVWDFHGHRFWLGT